MEAKGNLVVRGKLVAPNFSATSSFSGALQRLTSNITSIGTDTWTTLDFVSNGATVYDTEGSLVDAGTGGFVIPSGTTRVRFFANVSFTDPGSTQLMSARIIVNSAFAPGLPVETVVRNLAGENYKISISSAPIVVSASQVAEFQVQYSETGTHTVNGTTDETWFGIELIE